MEPQYLELLKNAPAVPRDADWKRTPLILRSFLLHLNLIKCQMLYGKISFKPVVENLFLDRFPNGHVRHFSAEVEQMLCRVDYVQHLAAVLRRAVPDQKERALELLHGAIWRQNTVPQWNNSVEHKMLMEKIRVLFKNSPYMTQQLSTKRVFYGNRLRLSQPRLIVPEVVEQVVPEIEPPNPFLPSNKPQPSRRFIVPGGMGRAAPKITVISDIELPTPMRLKQKLKPETR